jgi:Flp pilus assembly protein TadG
MTHPRETKSNNNRPMTESGQSMLELAVCLPLFVLLILGAAELANVAWSAVQLHNAARAGAQFASLSRSNAANTSAIQTAAQNEAPALTLTFPTAPSQACSCIDPTTGTTGANSTGCQTTVECPSPYIIFDNVTVTVQAAIKPLIHYPGLPATYTFNTSVTMGVVN